jgi:Protein of unknown function (DUF3617)
MQRVTIAISVMCLGLAGCGSNTGPDQNGPIESAAASQRLQPGLWEQVGGPMAAVSAATGSDARRCITPEEAKSTNGSDAEIKSALEAQIKKDGCTLSGLTIKGPVIAYDQTCSGAKMHVTTSYHGTTSTFELTEGGKTTMSTKSRRVGDC